MPFYKRLPYLSRVSGISPLSGLPVFIDLQANDQKVKPANRFDIPKQLFE